MGRYFNLRMHPISVGEIRSISPPKGEIRDPQEIEDKKFQDLLKFGGFPEPFLKSDTFFYNKWSNLRTQLLFREDLRDLSNVQDLGKMEMLSELIRKSSGQLLTCSSLGKKLQCSDKTVNHWISMLKSLYYCFELYPWSKNISRSLLKTPKYFLWDWSLCEDEGQKGENFVASHLLKATHLWTDLGMGQYGLHFIRDREKREVDFLVTKDNNPWFLVEVKLSQNKSISSSLKHFQKKLNIPHAFQVAIDMPYVNKDCFNLNIPIIVPAKTFLSQLI